MCDFFPLPRVCTGCGDAAGKQGHGTTAATARPTHVHEAANSYTLVTLTPSNEKDAAGVLTTVADGGATVASATQQLGLKPNCDHGNFGFPKSFADPVKSRRLQYGWVQGPGLSGEEDGRLGQLTLKENHQSLVREVTYDPRLGQLYFFPVEETALLRGAVLASIASTKVVPTNGTLALQTPPMLANQSEVRVSFAMPTAAVTFGVRVMTAAEEGSGIEFHVHFVPPPAPGAAAWSVTVGSVSHSATAIKTAPPPPQQQQHGGGNQRRERPDEDPAVATTATIVTGATASALPGYNQYNGSDCNEADIPGMDIRLAAGTTDAQGLATCAAVCSNHSACGAFVFISGEPHNPTPGGPRCAFKPLGSCSANFRGVGCTCSVKIGSCHHPSPPGPSPPPHPSPPRPPPPSPPQASGQPMPMLASDTSIDLALYVDHTVVEAYFMGGRYALTQHVPPSLLLPSGNNTVQGIEIFASGSTGAAGVVSVLNATVWQMSDIWDDVPSHGRPWKKQASPPN